MLLARPRAGIGTLLAARLSACMSDKPFSPSWTSRSQSEIPISRLARMFSPPWSSSGKRGMQWSVVSLVGRSNVGTAETQERTHQALDAPANEMDLPSAKAALDRIVIPEDTIDRIAQMVSPRSSLIISDEGPSSETGRGHRVCDSYERRAARWARTQAKGT